MTWEVNENHLGSSECSWRGSPYLSDLRPLDPLSARRVVVVAPHPDDEVFGAGGLLQLALDQKIPIEVVAVTDGEKSHPLAGPQTARTLGRQRPGETRVALRRLGWNAPKITRLHLPDGDLSAHQHEIEETLRATLRPGDLCVAPWRRDGHPDHDACGEAARIASQESRAGLLGYLVWTWHWASPQGTQVPWQACRRVDLSRRQCARKRWATGAFVSQIHPVGPRAWDAPVLPEPVLRRFWRRFEVFVDETGLPS